MAMLMGIIYLLLVLVWPANNRRYESPTIPAEIQNFPLSKTRLNKNNIVYSDEHKLCVRIKEKMVQRSSPNDTNG